MQYLLSKLTQDSNYHKILYHFKFYNQDFESLFKSKLPFSMNQKNFKLIAEAESAI